MTPEQMAAYIRDRLDKLDGPELIANACALMLDNQKALAEESGISPTTITQLKRGQPCSPAQRSAIYWAAFQRLAARSTRPVSEQDAAP
jgi:DNA-binding transcriptional regulator YdaS (Cro superfamily)